MINFQLSNHAKSRSTQRNIHSEELELVLEYGTDVPAGSETNRRFLRQYQFQEIHNDGYSVQTIERAFGLEAIVSNEGLVITCYKVRSGKPNIRRKKHSSFKRINRLSCRNAYK